MRGDNFEHCHVTVELCDYYQWRGVAVDSMKVWMEEFFPVDVRGLLYLVRPPLDRAIHSGELVVGVKSLEEP